LAKTNTVKGKTIFDLLSCLFDKKTKWNDLSDVDQKQFSPYMINRFISMDPDYIETVNYLQQYTLTGMRPKDVYNLYLDLLPKKKFWAKYIKSKSEEDSKISKRLIEFLSQQEQWSTSETYDNLSFIFESANGTQILKDYLRMYGISEAEAFKVYGIPKK
jgi:hypothetical protein